MAKDLEVDGRGQAARKFLPAERGQTAIKLNRSNL
jgi:hypothetical protein